MSQVIVEVGPATLAEAGQAQAFWGKGDLVGEVTSSGTAQTVSGIVAQGSHVAVVINHGTEAIWVNFDGTAAVLAGHFVAPNTHRDFGPLKAGDTISVINDS